VTNATEDIQPLARVPTGIAGLDTILRGGLLQGGLYLVVGAPGSGKTVLANQVCFNRVAAGGRAAYVTLLAEAHSRMLAYLRPLAFFDPAPIGTELVYLSAYSALPEGGLDGLLELLRGVIRDHAATLLVLDGLGPAADIAPSDPAFRRFLSELQAYAEAYRCTTILLSQPLDDTTLVPVATMVDGVIELDDRDIGLRAVRELTVRKFRGSGYLRGGHVYDITDAGLVVHPRTEAVLSASATGAGEERARLPLGIPGLDGMLIGGLVAGSTTMLLGPPGSGKTMLGLHFLAAGARAGEMGLHFGFYEPPARLIGKADGAGLDLGRYVREGRVEIVWQAPLEEGMDALAERRLPRARRTLLHGADERVTRPRRDHHILDRAAHHRRPLVGGPDRGCVADHREYDLPALGRGRFAALAPHLDHQDARERLRPRHPRVRDHRAGDRGRGAVRGVRRGPDRHGAVSARRARARERGGPLPRLTSRSVGASERRSVGRPPRTPGRRQ